MPKKKASVSIKQPTTLEVALEITGTADMIQNAFSQKAVEQMLPEVRLAHFATPSVFRQKETLAHVHRRSYTTGSRAGCPMPPALSGSRERGATDRRPGRALLSQGVAGRVVPLERR